MREWGQMFNAKVNNTFNFCKTFLSFEENKLMCLEIIKADGYFFDGFNRISSFFSVYVDIIKGLMDPCIS